MEWRDQGILLSTQQHGETSLIIDVFVPSKGRHKGVVRGGRSRKMAATMQLGAQLDLVWTARLESHLGSFKAELLRSRTQQAMSDKRALAGLNAVTAMIVTFLPEREANEMLYRATEALLDMLEQQDVWPIAYLKWELALLEELGFGLNLEQCAVSGASEDLAFISPKTGRAVSRRAAVEWADRLFPLLPCLQGQYPEQPDELSQAFQILRHFFEKFPVKELNLQSLPAARARFCESLS